MLQRLLPICFGLFFIAVATYAKEHNDKNAIYETVWQRIYGGKSDDVARAVVALEKGESAIAGTCKSYDAKRTDICVTRMTREGQMRWRVMLGGKKKDEALAVARTADGGIVVLGRSKSFSKNYDYDLYVAKLTLEGKKVWEKTLGGDRDEYGGGIAGTDDGGVLVVGATESFKANGKDIYIVRLDKNGRVLRERKIGGQKDDEAKALTRTRDGKMAMVGYRESAEYAGDTDFFIALMNQEGSLYWSKTFGGSYEDELRGVTATVDYGIVAIGSTRSYGSSQSDLTVMKIDAKGKTIWHKVYGFKYYEYGNGVATTREGGFLLVGGTNTLGKGNHSLYALALDKNGELIWSHVYGGERKDIGYATARLSDGDIIVVGETESFSLTKKFYLIKLRKRKK
jgi:hypothetical protein